MTPLCPEESKRFFVLVALVALVIVAMPRVALLAIVHAGIDGAAAPVLWTHYPSGATSTVPGGMPGYSGHGLKNSPAHGKTSPPLRLPSGRSGPIAGVTASDS